MTANVSIGMLGHVDSGKTSLCKVLSTTGSTAAFDSSPQSIERGITLDLGFSSFKLGDKWNFTVVDCPGHSSLIRAVIGGSQIMDVMLLVLDITKGMEVQTAECLVLANLTSQHLIVLLNKVDKIVMNKRVAQIAKLNKLMEGVLVKTKFANAPIIPISAVDQSIGVENLKSTLLELVESTVFRRDTTSPFMMAVDHCFSIKGHGTVLTGTILQGHVKVNDAIEIPKVKEVRKVKSIQSFRVPIQEASAGDRVGVCVANLNSSLFTRTIISAPKLISTSVQVAVISLKKISCFKHGIVSKKRPYHMSIGYETVTAKLTIFKPTSGSVTKYNPSDEHVFVSRIDKDEIDAEFYAVAEFDSLTMALPGKVIIGSDLQTDVKCRLAFSGQIVDYSEDKNYSSTFLPAIRILQWKEKVGKVDRVHSHDVLIVRGFSQRATNVEHLFKLKVEIDLDEYGKIRGKVDSRFGQTDKLRIQLEEVLTPEQTLVIVGAVVKLRYATMYFRGGAPRKYYQN